MAKIVLEAGIRAIVDEFIAAGRPAASKQTAEERRQGYLASVVLGGEKEPVGNIQDTDGGHFQYRCYTPLVPRNPAPALIYFHGGCFVSGEFETHDRQMRTICNHAGASVFLVHTRLAPEYLYPAAHDDALQATQAILKQLATQPDYSGCYFLAGDSAGGNLALYTALALINTPGPQPAGQILIYPMLDPAGRSDSYTEYGDDYVITRDALLSGFDAYLADNRQALAFDALLARDDLGHLPATHIITAEYDPLRDEGEALYRHLVSKGVEVTCVRWLGVIHGFIQLAEVSGAGVGVLKCIGRIVR